MTAADGYAREVAEFLDVWAAAPAHRTGYRDVISSQKTGEDGRKLRASALRGLLAEVERLTELAGALHAERQLLARAGADRADERDAAEAERVRLAELAGALDSECAGLQVAQQDLQAAYDRLGGQAQRITEAASKFRAERDRLHDVLSEVLTEPWDLDDPALRGFARTRWIVAGRLQGWRDVLASTERSERDGDPDVCRDCYGRGDDFEGGACGRCHGTGAP